MPAAFRRRETTKPSTPDAEGDPEHHESLPRLTETPVREGHATSTSRKTEDALRVPPREEPYYYDRVFSRISGKQKSLLPIGRSSKRLKHNLRHETTSRASHEWPGYLSLAFDDDHGDARQVLESSSSSSVQPGNPNKLVSRSSRLRSASEANLSFYNAPSDAACTGQRRYLRERSPSEAETDAHEQSYVDADELLSRDAQHGESDELQRRSNGTARSPPVLSSATASSVMKLAERLGLRGHPRRLYSRLQEQDQSSELVSDKKVFASSFDATESNTHHWNRHNRRRRSDIELVPVESIAVALGSTEDDITSEEEEQQHDTNGRVVPPPSQPQAISVPSTSTSPTTRVFMTPVEDTASPLPLSDQQPLETATADFPQNVPPWYTVWRRFAWYAQRRHVLPQSEEEARGVPPVSIGRTTALEDESESPHRETDYPEGHARVPASSAHTSADETARSSLSDRLSQFLQSSRDRVLSWRTSLTARLQQQFASNVSGQSAEEQPNPDDDPTHQQLIFFGGLFLGPVLFALGGILFFLTPRELKRTRMWGFLNLIAAVLCITVMIIFSFNEPSLVLSEHIEMYGPDDHVAPPDTLIEPGVLQTCAFASESAPSIQWAFTKDSSGWEPATKEAANTYVRMQKEFKAELPLERNESNVVTDWVLHPQSPETLTSAQTPYIYWSNVVRGRGRLLFAIVFGDGSGPDPDGLRGIASSEGIVSEPPSWIVLNEKTTQVVKGDQALPKGFAGAGLRCVSIRNAAKHRSSGESQESFMTRYPSSEALWSLVWKTAGSAAESQTVHQIVGLQSFQKGSSTRAVVVPSVNVRGKVVESVPFRDLIRSLIQRLHHGCAVLL